MSKELLDFCAVAFFCVVLPLSFLACVLIPAFRGPKGTPVITLRTPSHYSLAYLDEDITCAIEIYAKLGCVRKDVLIKRAITGGYYAVITFVKEDAE